MAPNKRTTGPAHGLLSGSRREAHERIKIERRPCPGQAAPRGGCVTERHVRGWPGAAHPHLSPEGRSFPPGSRVELRDPVARFSGADGPLPRGWTGVQAGHCSCPFAVSPCRTGPGICVLAGGAGVAGPLKCSSDTFCADDTEGLVSGDVCVEVFLAVDQVYCAQTFSQASGVCDR